MKIIKRTSSKFAYRLSFLKVLNSPFRGLKLRWYFGNIKHGIPYFLPRKCVKCNLDDGLQVCSGFFKGVLPCGVKWQVTRIYPQRDAPKRKLKYLNIMPDITICTNEDCPLSYNCWRFNCPPSQYQQSYAKFEPQIYDVLNMIRCEMYLETPDNEKSDVVRLWG